MELWDILDENGDRTGKTIERGLPIPKGAYHLGVDIWIKNAKGEYLISRRSPDKQPDPGLWEPTCGSVIAGEDSLTAALREVKEELGITLDAGRGKHVTRFCVPDDCFIDCWLFEQEADINSVVLQEGETDAAKWAAADEIRKMASDEMFLGQRRVPYLNDLLDGVIQTAPTP